MTGTDERNRPGSLEFDDSLVFVLFLLENHKGETAVNCLNIHGENIAKYVENKGRDTRRE